MEGTIEDTRNYAGVVILNKVGYKGLSLHDGRGGPPLYFVRRIQRFKNGRILRSYSRQWNGVEVDPNTLSSYSYSPLHPVIELGITPITPQMRLSMLRG